MATKDKDATPEAPVATPAAPTLHVVTEAFVTLVDGAVVVYRKGQLVRAGDPHLRATPGRFAPFAIPEVRS